MRKFPMRARKASVVRATRRRNEAFWIAIPRAVNLEAGLLMS
jgi:hypothetical protein